MKSIIRRFVFNLVTLLVLTTITGALSYQNRPVVLSVIAVVLTIMNVLVQPVITLLFTPINLLTLGLLRWIPTSISLYVLTLSVKEFTITPLSVPQIFIWGLQTPELHFGIVSTYVILTFLYLGLLRILEWMIKEKK